MKWWDINWLVDIHIIKMNFEEKI